MHTHFQNGFDFTFGGAVETTFLFVDVLKQLLHGVRLHGVVRLNPRQAGFPVRNALLHALGVVREEGLALRIVRDVLQEFLLILNRKMFLRSTPHEMNMVVSL